MGLHLCMSPVSSVFHTEVTVSISLKNMFRVGTFLGEQDWDRASFQIVESGLIQLITEGRLRHPSGSTHTH